MNLISHQQSTTFRKVVKRYKSPAALSTSAKRSMYLIPSLGPAAAAAASHLLDGRTSSLGLAVLSLAMNS